MEQVPPFEPGGANGRHDHAPADWGEALARSVAHLAAQLTMAQIRLRALATELAARGAVDEAAVTARVRAIAAAEAGGYLRQNLGEALVEVIDVDALERDLVAYLDEGSGA
jgi:hypothetical protein